MKGSQQEAFEIRNRGVNNRHPLRCLYRTNGVVCRIEAYFSTIEENLFDQPIVSPDSSDC